MNKIKIILYTALFITSHTIASMGMEQLRNNIPKIEAEGTFLALNYLNEEDQKQFFENIHIIRNNSLSKSNLLLMAKAKKIRDEELKKNQT